MARSKKTLVSISQLLGKTLKKIEIIQTNKTLKDTAFDKVKEYTIYVVWRDAVGEEIARHATPIDFNHGVVTLEADSSVWVNELKFMKTKLISSLNEKLGVKKVKDIIFRVK